MISHLQTILNTRNNNLMRHIIPAFLSVIIAVTLLAGCGTSSVPAQFCLISIFQWKIKGNRYHFSRI